MAADKITSNVISGIGDLPTAQPEEVGLSSERLARIRPAIQRYVDKQLIPGAVTLVARHGNVVHVDAIGLRDVEAGNPMTNDTIFRIMSMTKPIVSVALMMLFEEGHFLLSDPVSKWIPEFANPMVAEPVPSDEFSGLSPYRLVPADRPITIRHMLTHTTGLSATPRGMSQEEFMKIQERQSPSETIGDFVKRYATVPLNRHPGEVWDYSRATCVVGYLVELMSGMPLDEYLRERIFKPLNMPDTYFYLPVEKLDRFAACYTPDDDLRIKLIDAPTPESRFVKEPHTYFMGSGGLVSTIADYFRFDQMMLNGGELDGARILGRKTVEFMTTIHTGNLPIWLSGLWSGFGLGFAVARNIDNINTLKAEHSGPIPWSVGTYTWGGAYCTYPFVDPVEDLIGIVMTQVGPYRHLNIRQEYAGLVYQALVD
ncbi:MAG TPA: beta-lactamase family protein [Dehalococcoidia bacterium]|nr:beta-lactamase family protein [Dehalococcoidia bacterium]